ncbi:MAG: valine--tRNA ligase, partial [Candidatus Diapherotrites archaeon]|nr:valine--tRNA ligase [Candidatus Diapherotrites archaeon]
ACSYSQTDFVARYKRMRGYNVFYPFGTDDNGLPTERLVEKNKNVRARDMSRREFIQLCMEFLRVERPKFIQDWINMGISADFSHPYSTIDDSTRKLSQWSFLDLFKKKRVYRKDAPAMWCPECQTGVAQVEVEDKMFDSTFNDIIFTTGKNNEKITVATTRPELLPACVALFFSPGDERYVHFRGKKARVPLHDFEVPILEDARVKIDKGTGIVMCCTFGDQVDMEWQKAYNLPIKTVIGENGRMTALSGKYSGLSIKQARKQIIEDLKNAQLLTSQKPINHAVNVHDRCSTPIEFVKSRQWFVQYLDLRENMLDWGNELKWFPPHMKHRYDNWINGLQWDWLISNQRYFGVAFPVWYCKKCNEPILADEKQLPVDPLTDRPNVKACPKCHSTEFIPETDVLNTWFTSSLTPQIAIQRFSESEKKKLFPMDVRPQAHEIITFWLFNTVVKSHLHFNQTPWKNAMISGFVTLKGEKMSKSKGNVVRPQEVLEKYGADSIRYWAASSKLGDDFDYQEKDVQTGKKFVTKLLNVAHFVFSNISVPESRPHLLETDAWILNRLQSVIENCTQSFDEFNYSKAKSEADYFFWHDVADNYLELVKKRVYEGTSEEKASAAYTLYHVLLNTLKLMAPFTPYITEETYQKHFRAREKGVSIHLSAWPSVKSDSVFSTRLYSSEDDAKWSRLLEIVSLIRGKKSEAKKSMKAEVNLTLTPEDQNMLSAALSDLKAVSNAKDIRTGVFNVDVL